MHYVNISKYEIDQLKEIEKTRNYESWPTLSPKLRYLLQRMLLGRDDKVVKDIARDASHRMGKHLFCSNCAGSLSVVPPSSIDKSSFLDEVEGLKDA